MNGIKTAIESKTIWSVVLLALINLGQIVIDNSEALQAALMGWVPEPWNMLVPPLFAVVVVLLGWLGVQGRVNAKREIGGMW